MYKKVNNLSLQIIISENSCTDSFKLRLKWYYYNDEMWNQTFANIRHIKFPPYWMLSLPSPFYCFVISVVQTSE